MGTLNARDRGRIAACLLQDRPRGAELLAGGESLPQLRARLNNDSAARELLQEIEREAERLLEEREPELPFSLFRQFDEAGERLAYERVYFTRRRRLNSFAIMAFMHPHEKKYVAALCDTIWSICGEVTWCLPAHAGGLGGKQEPIDLFAAETGFALSELAALLGELLPDMLRRRIAQEVERRLLAPFLEDGPYGWETSEHNWAAVCAGSIGAAALYGMEDEERLALLLERALGALDCFLAGYGGDGACAEGYLYWQYGFGYFVYFAALLKEASSSALDLFADEKVKQIALFQQKIFTSGRLVVNFSDSLAASGIFMGLSSCLREQYAEFTMPDMSLRAAYADDHCSRWAPAIRNLVWVKEQATAAKDGNEPLWPAAAYYMPDAQWLHSRAIAGEGIYSFAAKGGHNDEPHNHNDAGHFILHADGEAYLADLGSGKYTAHYFGEERYTLWCTGSQGHSVPVIGGELQRQGRQYRAEVLELELSEDRDTFALGLGAAYPQKEAGLASLVRRFQWHKKGGGQPWLELTDTFAFGTEGGAAVERFITLVEPKAAGDGELIIAGMRKLRICFDEEQWAPELRRWTDIGHFGEERSFYTLDFISIKEQTNPFKGRFLFRFEE